jgi:hypothetical protein
MRPKVHQFHRLIWRLDADLRQQRRYRIDGAGCRSGGSCRSGDPDAASGDDDMGLKAGRPTGRTAERVEHLKAKLVKEEPEMRLNVRMPKSEYRKLKRFAFEREMTIIKVVQVALSEYMSK